MNPRIQPFAVILFALLFVVVANNAHSEVITFTGQSGVPFTPFTEDGFDVSPAGGFPAIPPSNGNPSPGLTDGQCCLNETRVVHSTGAVFTFDSLDVLIRSSNQSVALTGFVNSVQTETQTIPGTIATFMTVPSTFSAPIDELLITSNDAGAGNDIDNIVLSTQPIPEPTSIAIWSLIGLGLLGFGYSRCCRKK